MLVDLNEFKGGCSCLREHEISVKGIFIEDGAIERLPELLKDFKKPAVICDENTYAAAGERVCGLLGGCLAVALSPKNLHADEKAVEKAAGMLTDDVDVLVAAGSGTIHDTTRYIAAQRGISFVSVPTAASVDGFVSTVAAMTWHGFKKTLPAVAPEYVLADSGIFSKAPMRLTAAGVCDLLGKYTALADWKISAAVTGEYICERVCALEEKALEEVSKCSASLVTGNKAAYEKLMYALILSGLAMQMVGNSRPASGAEHHLSHLWEMAVINPPLDAYHGEKVSVGLFACIEFYGKINHAIKEHKIEIKPYVGLDKDFIRECFGNGSLYDDIIKENIPDPLEKISLDDLNGKLEEIGKILDALPDVSELQSIVKSVGGVFLPEHIGLCGDIMEKSIKAAPYVRNRLTLMRISKMMEVSR
ncbi:MAG: sn-glycerol-1-phosphate dehydrogenase [Oscillospiraceae bacterium]|nr:sn-glycerol-1-phosphate dehydrogenase [Oscillospiraceae bacterium]